MGFFGGRSKESILIEAFYKVAFEMGYIESLLCLEAGAEKSEILRDTDYFADGASKKGDFSDIDQCYFGAFVYLPGRFVWFNQVIPGECLARLFSKEDLKEISEENGVDALISKWTEIESNPDLYLSAVYDPSFIYYDHIEMVRLLYDDGVYEISVRMLSGFRYSTSVRAKNPIAEARSEFVDRDDLRFLNARIAERNLRK